jgi:hypothetical protein
MLKPMVLAAVLAALPAGAVLAQAVPAAVPAPVSAPAGAAAAAPAQSAEDAAKDKQNEIICRKTQETGSLVKVKKTCHTRSQWAYIEQENKRMGQDFILNNQGRPSGN